MADDDFIRTLNDYHTQLLSIAQVASHLLDVAIDLPGDEWFKSACFLMRDQLVTKVEEMPFPEVQS